MNAPGLMSLGATSVAEYLSAPELAWPLVYRPLLILIVLCLICGPLSLLVVLKRLSFAGQGISHSAFGGIGLAAVIGVWMSSPGQVGGIGTGGWLELAIVVAFCVGSAILMSEIPRADGHSSSGGAGGASTTGGSGRGGGRVGRSALGIDAGIGLLLVAAMALGGVLVDFSRTLAESKGVSPSSRTWESVLFGSVQVTSQQDLVFVCLVAMGTLLTLWFVRRPLLFWAFDEQAAVAGGVPARAMRMTLMVILAVVVVASMRLVGVVPASALLVLPAAIALRLSTKLRTVLILTWIVGVLASVVSMALALELNIQPGPSLVLLLTVTFFVFVPIVRLISKLRRPASPAASPPSG